MLLAVTFGQLIGWILVIILGWFVFMTLGACFENWDDLPLPFQKFLWSTGLCAVAYGLIFFLGWLFH